jgi:5-methyltetrahydrofolate--homocysteine methyltransferase
MYLPEVLHSAGAMNAAMDILKPLLLKDNVESAGRIVMGTVKGDMHDIGKNLVSILLRGAGIEVIDIGVQASPEKFVEAIRIHRPAVVGMSAMLTTTMLAMKTTIEAITVAGLRSSVKIIVGGAPVTQRFADEIGADAYARDAVRASEKVKELLAVA